MKDFLSPLPLRSGVMMQVTQSLADFGLKTGADGGLVRLDGSRIKRHPAFTEWMHRLKPGERLPRGRWFRNKRPGRPLRMMDELHLTAAQNPWNHYLAEPEPLPGRSVLDPAAEQLARWQQATGRSGGLEEYQRFMLDAYTCPKESK